MALRSYEWFWVTGLCGLLSVLLVVAVSQREPSLDYDRAHYLTAPVTVTVSGAVAHPGSYELPAGSTVGDLLVVAEPTPAARLKGLSKRKKLVHHQRIEIPAR